MTKFDERIQQVFSTLVQEAPINLNQKWAEDDAGKIAAAYDKKPIALKALDVVTKNPDRQVSQKYKELQVLKKQVLVPYLQQQIDKLKQQQRDVTAAQKTSV